MFEEPLPDGASKGMIVDLEPLLEDYYRARNWQRDTGYPSPEKMKELGLEALDEELQVINCKTVVKGWSVKHAKWENEK